jgi:cytochrome b561
MLIFHWATAALVLLAYLTSEGGASVRTDPPTTHIVLGLSVLSSFARPSANLSYGRGSNVATSIPSQPNRRFSRSFTELITFMCP